MNDNCPNCCHPDIAPHTEHDDGEQITARYRCPRCGNTWTCSRLVDAYLPRFGTWNEPAA